MPAPCQREELEGVVGFAEVPFVGASGPALPFVLDWAVKVATGETFLSVRPNREATMANRIVCSCAAVFLLSGAGSAGAQTGQPNAAQADPSAQNQGRLAQFQAGVDKAARLLENDPRLKDLTHQQRVDLVEFVTGNMLFALLHEMGHAHIQEMGLPVIGREEDGADSYAITALLKVGGNVSKNALIAATTGWFLDSERNQKEGTAVPYYDAHSVDKQRAYQIVCLMVGSDPDTFSDLADKVKLPQDRQGTCAGDYSNASWSWELVLKPHLRAADHPKQKITVVYGSPGGYPDLADAMRATGMIEMVADYAASRFVWRRPITFNVQSCGQPDLHWELSTQRILVCYEMAADFGQLYRGYGLSKNAPTAQPAAQPKAKK
jgi:hypothetical protein